MSSNVSVEKRAELLLLFFTPTTPSVASMDNNNNNKYANADIRDDLEGGFNVT